MPQPDLRLSTRRGPVPDALGDDDRLLLERARLGLRLILAGVVVVFVGWIVLNPGERPLLSAIQAANFAVVALALRLLRDPPAATFNLVVAFAAYGFTIVATAAVGIVAGDATTAVFILVGMAVIAAVLVPAATSWQIGSVILTVAAVIWAVATVHPTPPFFWLQNVGAIAPTLIGAVFVSRALRRQRAETLRAEHARRSREAGLREANARLEREIEEHRKTEAALRFAMRELDHRVKNTLATVQSVAEQTLHSSGSMAEFGAAFSGRIHAMARIHVAMAGRHWEGLPLSELIELVVGPYRQHAGSVAVDCNGVFVAAELVRALGMTMHELATNAAKYGALSCTGGQVLICSRAAGTGGAAPRLHISWSETGGPPVATPGRRGFGLRLIEEALAYEAAGSVDLQFPDQGVRCEIDVALPPPA